MANGLDRFFGVAAVDIFGLGWDLPLRQAQGQDDGKAGGWRVRDGLKA